MNGNLPESFGADGHFDTVINILCKVHSGIKIVHFNARSLSGSKLDVVRHTFASGLVDVICVSETWFNYLVPDSIYDLQGYNLFRNDRTNKRGGGVAIYCKTSLGAKLVSNSQNTDVEYINILVPGYHKLLVSCVYNPHRNNPVSPFFVDLTSRLSDYDSYVICGDFNVNILVDDHLSISFQDLVSAAGLNILNNYMPTRFGNGVQPSLLDLFLVSDKLTSLKFDQISFVSDHDLIFCSLDIPINCPPSDAPFVIRDYKNINVDALNRDLLDVLWSDCWHLHTADSKLDWLMTTLNSLFEKHVLLKSIKPKCSLTPWFTSSVLNALKQRNISRSRWKRCPSESNWHDFIRLRKRAQQVMRQAKADFYSRELGASCPSRQLWRNLRKLKVIPNDYRGCNLSPDSMVEFFSNVSVEHVPVNEIYTCQVENAFEFNAVTETDVFIQMSSISSNAVGSDGISLKFIKLVLPFIVPTITHIVNHCFTTSVFPSAWKVALITPVPKKVNASTPNDYRPISILPALAKMFEKILAEQIQMYINKNNLLSPVQSGFRAGHSCETAVMKILDDLRVPFDNNLLSCLCLLDYSKAFDTVNHELLCSKLRHFFHFSISSLKLIKSYLSGRVQKVRIGDAVSRSTSVLAGVPQGSILGPLLFVLFLNDIFDLPLLSSIHAYADDVQLYLSDDIKCSDDLVKNLNRDLDMIAVWSVVNGLSLNVDKCCVLPICFKRLDFNLLPVVKLNGMCVQYVDKVKNLGFLINSNMSCTDHVNLVLSKVYMTLRNLRLSSSYVPVRVKRNLVLQLVLPHFRYFCNVYSKLDSLSCSKITVAFNLAVRYVFSLRRADHIQGLDRALLGVGIIDYLEIVNARFLKNLLVNSKPKYLFDKIKTGQSARSAQLIIPRFKHLNSSRLFFVNTIRLWNSLPLELRQLPNGCAFKKALIKHYLSLPCPNHPSLFP